MDSPRALFRTAVNKNAPHEARNEAIDTLVEVGATTQLRVIVVTDGLSGSFRRRALNGLDQCQATAALSALVNDVSLPTALQQRAERLR